MQCVHQSLNGTCVASCSSPFLLRQSVSGSCSHTPVNPCQFFFTVKSTSFCITNFCLLPFHLCTMLPALQARRRLFDHSLSLSTDNWTCFTEAKPHVHCAHSVVRVQLDHRSISSISNVRTLFIQHHVVSSSDNFLHWNGKFDNTHTSECYAPLNSVICLEWNSQVCSPFAATNFCGVVLRSSLTHGNIPLKHDIPRNFRVLVTVTFTHLSFTSVSFLELEFGLLSTLNSDS